MRRRGKFLTLKGLTKIREAIKQKLGSSYTYKDVSRFLDLNSNFFLSYDTVSNILNQSKRVYQKSLVSLFAAFGLILEPDYITYYLSIEPDLPICQPYKLQNFFGRDSELSSLDERFDQGAKVILIQGAGGIGKTLLAHKYLDRKEFELVLPLLMAKEPENITAVESIVEEWLVRYFQEKSAALEFGIALNRLKQKLAQANGKGKIGVLIDNLETALDEQGRFIPSHRRYLELLRVLGDPSCQAITLITSRDRLCEPDINVERYALTGLEVAAWKEFFTSRNIAIDNAASTAALTALHQAYGGNAKAMHILSGYIRDDFKGDIAAYWQKNKDFLAKTELRNLVASQFDRLQKIAPAAYQLLCRAGCYRYQDETMIAEPAMTCLLWETPEHQRSQIVELLRDRSLLESDEDEYWLHPAIREEALNRLRASNEWQATHELAAQFWTNSVEQIETVDDALQALEAYYHYIEIKDWERASDILIQARPNQEVSSELLGFSFLRLGLTQPIEPAIDRVVDKVAAVKQAKLYSILGNLYWLTGQLRKCIECSGKAEKLAIELGDKELQAESLYYLRACKFHLGEITECLQMTNQIIALTENTASFDRIGADSCYIKAFLCLITGDREAAEAWAIKSVNVDLSKSKMGTLSQGYRFIILGLIYKQLQQLDLSWSYLQEGLEFAEKANSQLLKAEVFKGFGSFYLDKGAKEESINYYHQAVELLEQINAKCYLADGYYQLATAYKILGNNRKSKNNFERCLKLFQEIEAPKRVREIRVLIAGLS